MWSAARRVGRLVEGRVDDLRDGADARHYAEEFKRVALAGPTPLVIIADYRKVKIFPPAATDELRALMEAMNPHVERSSVLVAPEHATHALQVDRVVREAHLDTRRRFTDAASLLAWIGEVLTPAESERARAFLAET